MLTFFEIQMLLCLKGIDSSPQTTLVLPPNGRLSDKLADNAVHDYDALSAPTILLPGKVLKTYIQNRKSETQHRPIHMAHKYRIQKAMVIRVTHSID